MKVYSVIFIFFITLGCKKTSVDLENFNCDSTTSTTNISWINTKLSDFKQYKNRGYNYISVKYGVMNSTDLDAPILQSFKDLNGLFLNTTKEPVIVFLLFESKNENKGHIWLHMFNCKGKFITEGGVINLQNETELIKMTKL